MILDNQPINTKKTNDDNLIPLINVVFLMLIFFMVAGHIEASDGVDVSPPSSFNDNVATEDLKLVVTSDGQLYSHGSLINESTLSSLFDQQLSERLGSDDVSVQLKADANLTVEQLQDVLLLIKSAGIQHISLVTQLPSQIAR